MHGLGSITPQGADIAFSTLGVPNLVAPRAYMSGSLFTGIPKSTLRGSRGVLRRARSQSLKLTLISSRPKGFPALNKSRIVQDSNGGSMRPSQGCRWDRGRGPPLYTRPWPNIRRCCHLQVLIVLFLLKFETDIYLH